MDLTRILGGLETERNMSILNSLIDKFRLKNDENYEDLKAFYNLYLLKLAIKKDILKKESYKAIFKGEIPFYSEPFLDLLFVKLRRNYYFSQNGSKNSFEVRISFRDVQPFNIYSDCNEFDN